MGHAARHADTPVHTFLVPPHLATTVDPEDQIVYAVRTDPPPESAGLEQRLLCWRPVDELDMPVNTVRAALHRFALASNEGNDPRLWEPNGPDGVHGRGVRRRGRSARARITDLAVPWGSAYGTAIAAREPWALVAHSTLCDDRRRRGPA